MLAIPSGIYTSLGQSQSLAEQTYCLKVQLEGFYPPLRSAAKSGEVLMKLQKSMSSLVYVDKLQYYNNNHRLCG